MLMQWQVHCNYNAVAGTLPYVLMQWKVHFNVNLVAITLQYHLMDKYLLVCIKYRLSDGKVFPRMF